MNMMHKTQAKMHMIYDEYYKSLKSRLVITNLKYI